MDDQTAGVAGDPEALAKSPRADPIAGEFVTETGVGVRMMKHHGVWSAVASRTGFRLETPGWVRDCHPSRLPLAPAWSPSVGKWCVRGSFVTLTMLIAGSFASGRLHVAAYGWRAPAAISSLARRKWSSARSKYCKRI